MTFPLATIKIDSPDDIPALKEREETDRDQTAAYLNSFEGTNRRQRTLPSQSPSAEADALIINYLLNSISGPTPLVNGKLRRERPFGRNSHGPASAVRSAMMDEFNSELRGALDSGRQRSKKSEVAPVVDSEDYNHPRIPRGEENEYKLMR